MLFSAIIYNYLQGIRNISYKNSSLLYWLWRTI